MSSETSSPAASASVEAIAARAADLLAKDTRLADTVVTRPHPLLAMATRAGGLSVLLVPGQVWDKGRDLLKPFTGRLADGSAMMILLGHPRETDIAQALNRGLASILPNEPTADELL